MKKIIIGLFVLTILATVSFGKSSFIDTVAKEIIISKESIQQGDFKKEIMEINNGTAKNFKLSITIADTDSNIEGLEFVFLDDNFKFIIDKDTYDSLSDIERSSLSDKTFRKLIFEQNGSYDFEFQSNSNKFYIGVIYKIKSGKTDDLNKIFFINLDLNK